MGYSRTGAVKETRDAANDLLNSGRNLQKLETARSKIAEAATEANDAEQTTKDIRDGIDRQDDPKRWKDARQAAADQAKAAKAIRRASRYADRYAELKKARVAAQKANLQKVGIRVGAVLGVGMLVAGGLAWVFTYGLGRKVVGSGPYRFGVKDLLYGAKATDPTVTIDVLNELDLVDAGEKLILVKAVHLFDDTTKTQVDTLGPWTAADNKITYTAAAGQKVAAGTVKYVLEAEGTPGATTDPAMLTLVVLDELGVAATDRTSPVSVPVPASFQFAGTVTSDDEGAWTVDRANGKAIFTPKSSTSVTSIQKGIFYNLGNGGAIAGVTILFPAAELTGTATDRLPFALPAIVLPVGATLKLISPDNTNGTWSVQDSGKLQFSPATLPAAATTVTVDYAIVSGKLTSQPGKATINFPAVGSSKTPRNLTFITADRTKLFSFALPGVTLTSPAGDGQWTANAGNVTFQPNPTLAAAEVTVTAAYSTATEQGMLSLTYLPVPAAITQNGVARIRTQTILPTQVDVAKANPIQSSYTVKLWKNSMPVDTVQDIDANNVAAGAADWSLNGKSIVFTPTAKPFKNSLATVQYVLVAPDNTYTAPATAILAMSNDPVAYDATFENVAPGTFTIDFLSRCFIANTAAFASATFRVTQPATGVTATQAGTPPRLQVVIPSGTPGEVKVEYAITDDLSRTSNTNLFTLIPPRMTARQFLPMAADVLLPKSPGAGQKLGVNVLTPSSAFYAIDPTSVKLAGPQTFGQSLSGNCLLAVDGKTMQVENEGIWLVDDSGQIIFSADPTFADAPTPAAYTFADIKGNLSNQGVVMMDPDLTQLQTVPAQLATQDDDTFWTNFAVNFTWTHLDQEDFIAGTKILAEATLAATKGVGPNPLSPAAFDRTYQAWLTAGHVGLLAICAKAVQDANQDTTTPLRERYWRLENMCRMAARNLPNR